MKVLLKVGRFHIDGGVEMTMIQMHIHVHKCDFRERSVQSELDWIMVIEVFKELVGVMVPEEEGILNKPQPESGLIECQIKKVLFKKAYE